MPLPQSKSLESDEVYALAAYILAQNRIIGEDDVMDARTLPQVRMPNRDGFVRFEQGR
jgi:cytochrome c